MADYIKREDAIKAACDCVPHSCDIATCGHGCAEAEVLSKLPAEDVRPVVRGKWSRVYDSFMKSNYDTCSYCGKEYFGANGFNLCPNCGADMRGGGGDE